eukprot:TRINITY_DN4091_c0_g1_i1.p1 TRINITY_DN4091_c0_g1~~TRINITY_DN4091_c0_g1_i1.p1  ORF type:complete len:264 (-),score=45.03 TRINITY_DN4091_c0_g1_i1:988-1779(-)
MTNRLLQQFNGLYIHSAPRISTQSPSALTIDQQSASFAQSIREIHRRTDFQEIQSMPINDHISQLRQRLSALNDENPNGGSRWMVSWKGHKPNDATPQEPILYSRVETLLCQSYEAEIVDISDHHLNHPDHQPATDMNDDSDLTKYFTPTADSNQDQQVVQMEEPQSRDTYPDEGVTETESVQTASHTCTLITVEVALGLEPFLEGQDPMVRRRKTIHLSHYAHLIVFEITFCPIFLYFFRESFMMLLQSLFETPLGSDFWNT